MLIDLCIYLKFVLYYFILSEVEGLELTTKLTLKVKYRSQMFKFCAKIKKITRKLNPIFGLSYLYECKINLRYRAKMNCLNAIVNHYYYLYQQRFLNWLYSTDCLKDRYLIFCKQALFQVHQFLKHCYGIYN